MNLHLMQPNKFGPAWTNGGPSAASVANEQAQTAFMQQQMAQQATLFQESQDLHAQLVAQWGPIFDAGPNQYGFSPEEDAALRSQIISTSEQAQVQAEDAQQLAEKQAGGGLSALPSGATQQLEEAGRVLGAQSTAGSLSNEKLTGYLKGNENFTNASAALSGQQVILNPIGQAAAANSAAGNATNAIKLVDSERSSLLSSIMGGLVGAGTSYLTGGLSNLTNNKNWSGQ